MNKNTISNENLLSYHFASPPVSFGRLHVLLLFLYRPPPLQLAEHKCIQVDHLSEGDMTGKRNESGKDDSGRGAGLATRLTVEGTGVLTVGGTGVS